LARPGGNTTGFTAFEYAIGGKWLELLKEIAPSLTRALVLRDPTIAAGIGQFAAIQATAPFGIELSAVGLHDVAAVESAVAGFAREANGGLMMTAGPFGGNHPDVITDLAARYKLPAVYPWRYFVTVGGLMSYGSDLASQFRSAAQYVNRILKGEKPADLPVQAPTKYELIINMKTAKALGLEVPATVLARADEVIE
jgi:putative ABC transport system substrate-binding protein